MADDRISRLAYAASNGRSQEYIRYPSDSQIPKQTPKKIDRSIDRHIDESREREREREGFLTIPPRMKARYSAVAAAAAAARTAVGKAAADKPPEEDNLRPVDTPAAGSPERRNPAVGRRPSDIHPAGNLFTTIQIIRKQSPDPFKIYI